MYNYALMLYNGDGVTVDKKEAARYFQMAADLGDIDSMRKYRSMLYDGDGIEKKKHHISWKAYFFTPICLI